MPYIRPEGGAMDITGTLIQPQIALTMLISGAAAGAVFLIAGYIRSLWRYKWIEILTDLLSVLITGAILLLSIYATTKGDLRAYLFICFFSGMFFVLKSAQIIKNFLKPKISR